MLAQRMTNSGERIIEYSRKGNAFIVLTFVFILPLLYQFIFLNSNQWLPQGFLTQINNRPFSFAEFCER